MTVRATCWLPALIVCATLPACRANNLSNQTPAAQPRTPTFNQDIAPMVFERCSSCHRPGQPTPLPLLNYEDVRRRAGQVLVSLQRRTMPPWLPAPGSNEFMNARVLRPEQIATFQAWVDAGTPQGPAPAPAPPAFPDTWQLGEPDIVIRAPQPYTVTGNGEEVVRSFTLPIPISATRQVRAMEFRPDNSRILRHAVIGVDRTSSARKMEARDRNPGYAGMIFDHLTDPRDRLHVWVPGTAPWVEPEGLGWRIEPGSDLVVQLQVRATRDPESIQPSVGLFFSDTPPVRQPILIKLEATGIDIPAGSRDYLATNKYVLPVDVQVLSVYPHAHDLAKTMTATASLPGGTTKDLLRIEDWDPHWAEQYWYARPIDLPSGTALTMEYVYDNSDRNMRNPNDPPKRVRRGSQLRDEMGMLWLEVLPRNDADAARLLKDAPLQRTGSQTPGRQD